MGEFNVNVQVIFFTLLGCVGYGFWNWGSCICRLGFVLFIYLLLINYCTIEFDEVELNALYYNYTYPNVDLEN